MTKKLLLALIVAVVLIMPAVVFADLTYDGSTTIGENIMPEAARAFEVKTKVKFSKVGSMGSGKGFKMLMNGEISVAGMSRGLTYEEKALKPYYQIIGYDAIAVFVNEKNPVKELTKAQVKGIFTGKITNWKEVGGDDVPIAVITEVKTGGRATIKEFQDLALNGAEYGPSKEIDKPRDCVRAVGADGNAITHATLAFKESGVKAIPMDGVEPSPANVRSGSYLLSRPLLLVAKGIPEGELKKFFDFMFSQEGQEIIRKNFVSVK